MADGLSQLLSEDDETIHRICAVKSERYIPAQMRIGVANAKLALSSKRLIEQPLFAQSLARYVIYVDDMNVTFEVFQYLIYWVTRYSWDEAYCVATDEDHVYQCMALADETTGVVAAQSPGTRICYEMADELRYSMERYEPTYSHCMRLTALSRESGVLMHTLKRLDLDIRLRRERFFSPDLSIRTCHGRDYLFIRFADKSCQRYKGCFVNVGAACTTCGVEKQNPVVCARCQEAVYCCDAHRRADIARHRTECGVSL